MIKVVSKLSQWGYAAVVKPVFFIFEAEAVHDTVGLLGQFLGRFSWTQWITKKLWAVESPNLKVTVDGIQFPNRVGLSAGFDYNGELTGIMPAVGFGWHSIGTVTYLPYAGNPTPRLGRLPRSKALLVNKGLKNAGARAIIARLEKTRFIIPTGISIASTNKNYPTPTAQVADILMCFTLFERSRLNHAYYELNISCPNTFGGEPFTSPARLEWLLTALDNLHLTRPVYLKLPVDLTDREALGLLRVADRRRVAGVILGNLTKDHANPAVHPDDRVLWSQRAGNLSGKPTWSRSNHLIELTRKQYPTRFTIIGTGGIFSGEDAATKLELGADLVQLITGMIFRGPQVIGQINEYLREHPPLDRHSQHVRRTRRRRTHQ